MYYINQILMLNFANLERGATHTAALPLIDDAERCYAVFVGALHFCAVMQHIFCLIYGVFEVGG